MSQEPVPPPVRQRNTTAYPWTFAETENSPARTVLPGETTDHPVLLDGWTAADEPEAEPEAANADEQPKTPSRKRAAAADTDKDGGESR